MDWIEHNNTPGDQKAMKIKIEELSLGINNIKLDYQNGGFVRELDIKLLRHLVDKMIDFMEIP